jgi:hypothetical protein
MADRALVLQPGALENARTGSTASVVFSSPPALQLCGPYESGGGLTPRWLTEVREMRARVP